MSSGGTPLPALLFVHVQDGAHSAFEACICSFSRSYVNIEGAFNGRPWDRQNRAMLDNLLHGRSCVLLVDMTLPVLQSLGCSCTTNRATSSSRGHSQLRVLPLKHFSSSKCPKVTDRLHPWVKRISIFRHSSAHLKSSKIDLQTEHGMTC